MEYKNKMWYEDASVLMTNINELWPSSEMTMIESVNALTRLFIIITAMGYVLTHNISYLLTGLVFIVAISVYGYAHKNKLLKYDNSSIDKQTTLTQEGFAPNMNNKQVEKDIKDSYNSKTAHENYETPTVKNPLSNVLLTEINDNPTRKPAPPAYLTEVEEDINENVKQMIKNENPNVKDLDKRLFTEVGDNFTLDRSMRQFYSMPNTQVPNDQKGFAEFSYGSMTSCKEGNPQACHRNAFRHRVGY